MLSKGGVYLAKLNPTKGSELGKLRPVIILTAQVLLTTQPPVVFICPLSSQTSKKYAALHIEIPPRQRLKKMSYALVEHCHSIAIERIIPEPLMQLESAEVNLIIERLNLLIT